MNLSGLLLQLLSGTNATLMTPMSFGHKGSFSQSQQTLWSTRIAQHDPMASPNRQPPYRLSHVTGANDADIHTTSRADGPCTPSLRCAVLPGEKIMKLMIASKKTLIAPYAMTQPNPATSAAWMVSWGAAT